MAHCIGRGLFASLEGGTQFVVRECNCHAHSRSVRLNELCLDGEVWVITLLLGEVFL
jgi:hypothetical protein